MVCLPGFPRLAIAVGAAASPCHPTPVGRLRQAVRAFNVRAAGIILGVAAVVKVPLRNLHATVMADVSVNVVSLSALWRNRLSHSGLPAPCRRWCRMGCFAMQYGLSCIAKRPVLRCQTASVSQPCRFVLFPEAYFPPHRKAFPIGCHTVCDPVQRHSLRCGKWRGGPATPLSCCAGWVRLGLNAYAFAIINAVFRFV